MDLRGVVSLPWLEVDDGRVGRPVSPVGVSFGGRSRMWLVGVVPFVVRNGSREAVATLCYVCWG